jgi:hypothetical protein
MSGFEYIESYNLEGKKIGNFEELTQNTEDYWIYYLCKVK